MIADTDYKVRTDKLIFANRHIICLNLRKQNRTIPFQIKLIDQKNDDDAGMVVLERRTTLYHSNSLSMLPLTDF